MKAEKRIFLREFIKVVSVVNKRIAVFIAVVLILSGVRLADNGLCGFIREGSYTVYDKYDRQFIMEEVPVLNVRGVYERVDLKGSYSDAINLLERMDAEILKEEKIDEVKIIYAYSPVLSAYALFSYGKVNVMIALSSGRMAVGSPLLKGSY